MHYGTYSPDSALDPFFAAPPPPCGKADAFSQRAFSLYSRVNAVATDLGPCDLKPTRLWYRDKL
jgi:hypothetical protein